MALVGVGHGRVHLAEVGERPLDDLVLGAGFQCQSARTVQDVLVLGATRSLLGRAHDPSVPVVRSGIAGPGSPVRGHPGPRAAVESTSGDASR